MNALDVLATAERNHFDNGFCCTVIAVTAGFYIMFSAGRIKGSALRNYARGNRLTKQLTAVRFIKSKFYVPFVVLVGLVMVAVGVFIFLISRK